MQSLVYIYTYAYIHIDAYFAKSQRSKLSEQQVRTEQQSKGAKFFEERIVRISAEEPPQECNLSCRSRQTGGERTTMAKCRCPLEAAM